MNPKWKRAVRRQLTRASAVRRRIVQSRTAIPPSTPEPVAVPPPAPAKPASDARYVGAWSRLAEAVQGGPVVADPVALVPAVSTASINQAKAQRAQAVLAEALALGEPLPVAVRRTVVALADINEWNAAWALAEGVGRLDGGALASTVGHAVMLHKRRQLARVWPVVAGLSDDELAAHVPVEAVDAAFAIGTPEARERAIAIAGSPERYDAGVLVDLAGRFMAMRERTTATALAGELRRRGALDLDERRTRSWALLEVWLDREPREVPAGATPVAIIDYQSPDQLQASGNVGDYVQTLALLGNLVRFVNVRFTGEDGLGELATELQDQVRPKLQLPEVSGGIHLLEVNRDFSSAENIPDGTWMVAFGWHMHPLYDLRYDFPYHPNIRPLFISFHVNRLDMLTDEALNYLRKYGPVGCRDWTTVFLLLSAGVDAFFSGCVTTTASTVFPTRAAAYDGGAVIGVIDIAPTAAGRTEKEIRAFTHQDDKYRHMSLTEGVRAAHELLAGYQRDLSRAVTRRLHAYLPLTALGVPVTFKPWSTGDVRFPGLAGLRPGSEGLKHIQTTIRDLLSQTLTKALAGADEQAVYELWRELTADLVAEAKAQFATPVHDEPTAVDVDAAVASSRAEIRRFGPHEDVDTAAVTDIVLCFDQNLTTQAPVMIESMLANASGPLRLTILGRGLDHEYQDWLAAAFPTVPMTFLPCDHIDYGKIGRIPARITISTMDRLLLPHLLDDVDRVVYVDIDVLVLGDICELGRIDLGGQPVAARDSVVSEAAEWRSAARRLPQDRAIELQRRMGFTHGYGQPALNAGVLVLDLARMRRDDFTRTYLGWVEKYGLHDQDVMLAYAGPDRRRLEPRWNTLPVFEDVADPAIVHWAMLTKPWDQHLTVERARWQEYATRLRARVGAPPVGSD